MPRSSRSPTELAGPFGSNPSDRNLGSASLFHVHHRSSRSSHHSSLEFRHFLLSSHLSLGTTVLRSNLHTHHPPLINSPVDHSREDRLNFAKHFERAQGWLLLDKFTEAIAAL